MPKVISLPKNAYASMVKVMKLPYRGIETTSVVGPFFWSSLDHNKQDPHLRKLGTVTSYWKVCTDCIYRYLAPEIRRPQEGQDKRVGNDALPLFSLAHHYRLR